jgi:hypothetical protein
MSLATTHKASTTVQKMSEDAYVFGYPLVLVDITRQVMTNVSKPTTHAAPINQFCHLREFPSEADKTVVSPNADTLYSTAFLDLSREPVILSVPAMKDRYYLMQIMDAWSNVFASPGTRTTGQDAGAFAITGPSWSGTLPHGVHQIKSPTNTVWIIGRTQTNGSSDYEAVRAIQDKYNLEPASAWGTPYTLPSNVPTDLAVDMHTPPVKQAANMKSEKFFARLAQLLQANPPSPPDADMMSTLTKIGIKPGRFAGEVNPEMEEGAAAGKARILKHAEHPVGRVVNGWKISTAVGRYGTDYDQRAAVALIALGANVPEDAIYPGTSVDGDGNPLVGVNRYVIRFDKGKTPPVNAFWSVTMYDDQHFMVANPIRRHAIGDRDKLQVNSDGSLDFYLQHDSPGKAKESNWLPSPPGRFNLILRMYWPKPEALDGTWKPPAVKIAR